MSKIDLTKPIEAVHKISGRVVPVTVERTHISAYSRSWTGFRTKECPNGAETNREWHEDGTDWCSKNLWFVRNVAEAPKVDWTKPIETVDGVPMRLRTDRRSNTEGRVYVTCEARIHDKDGNSHPAGSNFVYETDGTHAFSSLANMRNRQETPVSTLDLSKPLQTRGGRTADFVAKLEDGRLLFAVWTPNTKTLVITYADGRLIRTPGAQDQGDAINVKPKPVLSYRNVYDDGSTGKSAHKTFNDARDRSKVGKVRIGIFEIETTDGVVTNSKLHRCVPAVRSSAVRVAAWNTPI